MLFVSTASYGGAAIQFTRDAAGRILLPVIYSDGQSADYMLSTSIRRLGVRQDAKKPAGVKVYPRRRMSSYSLFGLVKLPLARFDNVSFDGRLLTETIGGVYPSNSTAAGLLGYQALGNHLVYIQPAKSTVTFLANSGMFSREGWLLLGGRPNRHGGIVLSVEHQGVQLDVLLDSSLSRSVLDRGAAKALGIEPGKGGKKTRFIDVAVGIFYHKKTWPCAKIKNLTLDGWLIGDLEVGVSKLPVAEATGKKDANLLILGADVLVKRDIALDFRHHQVWLPR